MTTSLFHWTQVVALTEARPVSGGGRQPPHAVQADAPTGRVRHHRAPEGDGDDLVAEADPQGRLLSGRNLAVQSLALDQPGVTIVVVRAHVTAKDEQPGVAGEIAG